MAWHNWSLRDLDIASLILFDESRKAVLPQTVPDKRVIADMKPLEFDKNRKVWRQKGSGINGLLLMSLTILFVFFLVSFHDFYIASSHGSSL